MLWILLLVALVVILSMAYKSYATKPRVLELREMSQTKAKPEDALGVVRNALKI